jgi:AraC-like DNA-binding protein
MSATRNTVFKLDGAHEFDVVAQSRDFITVGLRRSVLARTISGLIGRDFAIAFDMHRQLHVPEAYRRRLLAIVAKVITGASSNGSGNTIHRLPRSIEVAFMEAIADWIVETDHLNTSGTVSHKNELRIFRDSIYKIREADHSLLTIADLCQLVGVGKSRLHQAFSETYGISPGAYLHRLRLTLIRQELLSGETPPRSIKDVAIKHGFLSSGQFARKYREIFGELPGETLRKRMASSGSERIRTPRIRSRGHQSLTANANSEP